MVQPDVAAEEKAKKIDRVALVAWCYANGWSDVNVNGLLILLGHVVLVLIPGLWSLGPLKIVEVIRPLGTIVVGHENPPRNLSKY